MPNPEPSKSPVKITESKTFERIFDSKWFSVYHVKQTSSEDYEDENRGSSEGSWNIYAVRDNVTGKIKEITTQEMVIFLADKYAKHCENPDPSCPFIVEHTVGCSVV